MTFPSYVWRDVFLEGQKMRIRLAAFFAVVAVGSIANAQTLIVTIQPILAAENNGTNLSPMLAYTDYAAKIWAQADIQLNILTPNILNKTSYNQFNNNNASALVNAPGNGQNANPLVVNAWFVDNIINTSVYGFAFFDQPYMVMDTTNIAGFSALGRVDTFSHELGHVLNLPHYTGANTSKNLMASGGSRDIPQNLGDVAPDGLGLDFLTANQIATARNSRFAIEAVPEPATMSLVGIGLGIAALRRKRKAA